MFLLQQEAPGAHRKLRSPSQSSSCPYCPHNSVLSRGLCVTKNKRDINIPFDISPLTWGVVNENWGATGKEYAWFLTQLFFKSINHFSSSPSSRQVDTATITTIHMSPDKTVSDAVFGVTDSRVGIPAPPCLRGGCSCSHAVGETQLLPNFPGLGGESSE